MFPAATEAHGKVSRQVRRRDIFNRHFIRSTSADMPAIRQQAIAHKGSTPIFSEVRKTCSCQNHQKKRSCMVGIRRMVPTWRPSADTTCRCGMLPPKTNTWLFSPPPVSLIPATCRRLPSKGPVHLSSFNSVLPMIFPPAWDHKKSPCHPADAYTAHF